MNCFDSPTIGQVLMEAQVGNQAAKERMANWMMGEVQAKVMSALKLERASKSQSSMISDVLVKLVRGETIQRTPMFFICAARLARPRGKY